MNAVKAEGAAVLLSCGLFEKGGVRPPLEVLQQSERFVPGQGPVAKARLELGKVAIESPELGRAHPCDLLSERRDPA